MRSLLTVFGSLAVISGVHLSIARAELTPGARYFSGQARVERSAAPCHAEVLYSGDGSQIRARAIIPLPHVSPSGQQIQISVGPHTASYQAARTLYRYQDPTPRARVKDLVLTTANQVTPTRLQVLYWHVNHHDPVACNNLVEKTTLQELQEMEQIFARFAELSR